MPLYTTVEEVKDLIEQYHADWLLPHIHDIVHLFNQTDGTGRVENLIKNLKNPPFGHEDWKPEPIPHPTKPDTVIYRGTYELKVRGT